MATRKTFVLSVLFMAMLGLLLLAYMPFGRHLSSEKTNVRSNDIGKRSQQDVRSEIRGVRSNDVGVRFQQGLRSENRGVRSNDIGVRSQEDVKSENRGVRSNDVGVRSQQGVRSENRGVRSNDVGVRSQQGVYSENRSVRSNDVGVRSQQDMRSASTGVRSNDVDVRPQQGVRSENTSVRSSDVEVRSQQDMGSDSTGVRSNGVDVRSQQGVRSENRGVRSNDVGVRSQQDMRSDRTVVRSNDVDVRSQPGMRSEDRGVRSNDVGVKFQPDARSDNTDVRSKDVSERSQPGMRSENRGVRPDNADLRLQYESKLQALYGISTTLVQQRNYLAKQLNKRQQKLGKIACEQLSSKKVAISKTGGWCLNASKEANDKHVADEPLAVALAEFFKGKRVANFGDGRGRYREIILDSGKVKGYDSYDGAPYADTTSEGRVKFLDLTLPQFGLPLYDWVMSLDVAEHIPQKFESVYIDNIVRHAREGVVISWTRPGQEGYYHINNRRLDYVVKLFHDLGFAYEEMASRNLRQTAVLPWLRNNTSVFRRQEYSKIDHDSLYFT